MTVTSVEKLKRHQLGHLGDGRLGLLPAVPGGPTPPGDCYYELADDDDDVAVAAATKRDSRHRLAAATAGLKRRLVAFALEKLGGRRRNGNAAAILSDDKDAKKIVDDERISRVHRRHSSTAAAGRVEIKECNGKSQRNIIKKINSIDFFKIKVFLIDKPKKRSGSGSNKIMIKCGRIHFSDFSILFRSGSE